MKCIAIDDEPPALKLLEHYCGRLPSVQLLGAYTDPVEGISYIRSMRPDLVFLDIRMPDISGVNIALSSTTTETCSCRYLPSCISRLSTITSG